MVFTQKEVIEYIETHQPPPSSEYNSKARKKFNWFVEMCGSACLESLAKNSKIDLPSADQMALIFQTIGLLELIEERMIAELAEELVPEKHLVLCRDLGQGLWNCHPSCKVGK
jgi:hypothetical protein